MAAPGGSLLLLTLVSGLFSGQETPVPRPEPVVHAVLFYSPACPHCHKLIDEDLPPLAERFGSGLQIAGLDVTREPGRSLYLATLEHFQVPEDRYVVPILVVGEHVLVGGAQIPEELPGLVEEGLEAGGLAWPDPPELRETLEGQEAGRDTASAPEAGRGHGGGALLAGASPAGMIDRFRLDPVANGVAVLVLALLGVALAVAAGAVARGRSVLTPAPAWVVVALGLAGAAVAAYLSFVEVTGAEAVCGPVGDCNTVQQSAHARLFGVVPVGLLGLGAYAAMTGTWLTGLWARGTARRAASRAVWGMALVGTAFSAWLTFLEPFVIGATCAWCLASSLIVALILLLATADVTAQRAHA